MLFKSFLQYLLFICVCVRVHACEYLCSFVCMSILWSRVHSQRRTCRSLFSPSTCDFLVLSSGAFYLLSWLTTLSLKYFKLCWEKVQKMNWYLNEANSIIALLFGNKDVKHTYLLCGATITEFYVLQFPGRQWGASSMRCWYKGTLHAYIHACLFLAQKCFPCVDRVLIKGFWTHWLKATTITKLLSYFCSLTKVSVISCDLFGPVQWGMQFILDWTGLGGEGRREGNVGSTWLQGSWPFSVVIFNPLYGLF